MKGLISTNAYSDNEEYYYQPKRLKEEFAALNVDVDICRNDDFPFVVENGKINGDFANKYDFCIYLDKDKYILDAISKTDVPLFNGNEAITVCDDKMLTYLALANCGIPMPKTLPGLLCYQDTERIKEFTVSRIEKELSYPIIVKESFGSLGKGVFLAHNRTELLESMEALKCRPHLFQQFIKTSVGRDIRIIVIGGKAIGAMMRISENDFRSNLGSGGFAEQYEPTKEMLEMTEKIADILKLDYCGIDILLGENDKPILCEVNSNAFFYGFEKTTGINVAKIYAEYIYKKIDRA